jgi:hypothetical protein
MPDGGMPSFFWNMMSHVENRVSAAPATFPGWEIVAIIGGVVGGGFLLLGPILLLLGLPILLLLILAPIIGIIIFVITLIPA